MSLPKRDDSHRTYGDHLHWTDDRIVTIYRLKQGRYGRPELQEPEGKRAVGVKPEVEIDRSLYPLPKENRSA